MNPDLGSLFRHFGISESEVVKEFKADDKPKQLIVPTCMLEYIGLRAPGNEEAMSGIIEKHKATGLRREGGWDALLQKGDPEDWVRIARGVWAERDRAFRLDWLRSLEDVAHPILLAELAVAEFVADPTTRTLERRSVPILTFAMERVREEAKAFQIPEDQNWDGKLWRVYHNVLCKICVKNGVETPKRDWYTVLMAACRAYAQDRQRRPDVCRVPCHALFPRRVSTS